jgi:hypothetical protein
MQTLRRTAGVLIFPAIAYLGAACDRTDTPTEAAPTLLAQFSQPVDLVVDDDGLASITDCNALTPTFPTINLAIMAASPGQKIGVCPGVYNEMVNINKDNLTLLGAKSGVDARTRAFVLTDESVINNTCGPVQIMADNDVLDGFTVQGSTMSDPCFIAGIWSNPGFSGTHGGHTILNNIVQNNISGIELDSDCMFPTLVQFNLIQNNNNPGPGPGNGIETSFGLCNATIDRNKFSGHANTSMLLNTAQSNLTISNNELVGGTPERIVLANTSMSSITGNVSILSTSSGTIRLFGGNSNVTINSNTLLRGVRGIWVDNPFSVGINSGIEGHFNCIQGNSMAGLEVDAGGHSGTLNAENNWWGSSTGPTNANNPGGTGDAVIDPDNNVDFIPFLTSPPGPPCPAAPVPSGKVTGGGQITVSGGKGSFGFNAKSEAGVGSGHLNYLNHFTGAHLDCTVALVTEFAPPVAEFSGPCSANSTASSFMAHVEDRGTPGKNQDVFRITYPNTMTGIADGSTLISGNIVIHQ